MKRKKYYVAVETGQILEDQGASPYELEIEANDAELDALRKLFSKMNVEDIGLFIDPHLPQKWDEVEGDVQSYTDYLLNIYGTLYRLGTPETKQHIEQNRILEKLKGDWQEYDFS
jgi:hypothetical protein